MVYDKKKRRFLFQNQAAVPASAMLFYDLPGLLWKGEEICPEAETLASVLPGAGAPLPKHDDWKKDALPHQVEGIAWALSRHCTGIIADEMGLGKTFEAIRATVTYPRHRILVVCLSHLKHNWVAEIKKWEPDCESHICEGRDSRFSDTARFTLINRDILAANAEKLSSMKFDQIIVDELHKIGGWGTGAYKALENLRKEGRNSGCGILMLTGTLLKNSPMDAHSALHLIDKLIPGPRDIFQTRFDPIGKRKEEVIGLSRRKRAPRWLIGKKWAEIRELEQAHGARGDVAGLRWLLERYTIRRKYLDIFPADGKTRTTNFVSVHLDLSDREKRTLANKGIVDDDGKINAELATILKHIAEQKAPHVADFAENWLEENDGKLVIATWHIAAREILKTSLSRFGVVEIHGTPAQKHKAGTAFAENPNIRVCFINLESGGTGLNLVSSAHLIFSEVPWTRATFDQVKARIDRMGQEGDELTYTVFLAADTPEGAKYGTVRKKAGLNDRYL